MSVRPVTHFVAVCDSCANTGECTVDEQSAVRAQVEKHGWIVTATGLLCPPCQPCTECSHNSGPAPVGRLCPSCLAVACAGCGHRRSEHLHFINAALHRIPVYTCLLADGRYIDCLCPLRINPNLKVIELWDFSPHDAPDHRRRVVPARPRAPRLLPVHGMPTPAACSAGPAVPLRLQMVSRAMLVPLPRPVRAPQSCGTRDR